MMPSSIPSTANRTTLAPSIQAFLDANKDLHLGGHDAFTTERAHHLKVFGFHAIPQDKQHPIGEVEFTAVRGPHGTIPVRVFYPTSGEERRKAGSAGALVYMHGGGYTVGSVDEFENGLRLVAELSGVIVFAVEYRLAPEWQFPVQLDEYSAVVDAVQGEFGKARGVAYTKIMLYPEARVPFDTPACVENNTGLYLEANGIFSFASHYATLGTPPSHPYISPGMQSVKDLASQPPAAIFTSGFDPLRDVGVEYAHKLDEAGVKVTWDHYADLTHGWLQMTAWSDDAVKAVTDVAERMKKIVYEA